MFVGFKCYLMTIIQALVTSPSLSHTGHRILAIRIEQTIALQRLIVHVVYAVGKIKGVGTFNFEKISILVWRNSQSEQRIYFMCPYG